MLLLGSDLYENRNAVQLLLLMHLIDSILLKYSALEFLMEMEILFCSDKFVNTAELLVF